FLVLLVICFVYVLHWVHLTDLQPLPKEFEQFHSVWFRLLPLGNQSGFPVPFL
ncbi:hypothetical protein NDU88_006445, partial [Pleurodeles waltl]